MSFLERFDYIFKADFIKRDMKSHCINKIWWPHVFMCIGFILQ